jgi:phosphatidylserine/phosphatidylglycerophosphate/cardiolipin synthase-like enzyme
MNPMNSSTSNTPELVITAPEPHGLLLAYQSRCRTTLGVLCQLLTQASRRVIIASPFIHAGHGLADGVLANAVEAALRHRVNVDVLSTGASLKAIDWNRFLEGDFPKLSLFRPAANVVDEERLGSHAKFCVADGESAYVGSANLTGPGLAGQLEMGLLVHGELARQIEQFWTYLIEIGLFVPVSW